MEICETLMQDDYSESYKNKIKNLSYLNKQDQEIIVSFNGELSKSHNYSQIINQLNDKELLDLCAKIFPCNFLIENSNDDLINRDLFPLQHLLILKSRASRR